MHVTHITYVLLEKMKAFQTGLQIRNNSFVKIKHLTI